MISGMYLRQVKYNFWILQYYLIDKIVDVLSYMRTKDTYLTFKLEKAIARIQNNSGYNDSPVFLEICNCPTKGGSFFYDTKKAVYFGKGSCNNGLLCSKIQMDKHQILIRKSIPRIIEHIENEKILQREQIVNYSPELITGS